MAVNPTIPIILCGGKGTRLWPLSRESYPKQYLSFDSSNQKTLLQKTQERLIGIKNIKRPILVCSEEHRFIVAEQMNSIGVIPNAIILEPIGRNTAPAIAVAAMKALELEENPNILVMPSDHIIKDTKAFLNIIEKGIEFADKKKLVTFGIIPDTPETGFGYIQADKPLNTEKIEGQNIINFLEKPNLETAESLIKDNHYSWNSGIFLFQASVILKEIEAYCPKIIKYCRDSIKKESFDLDFTRLNEHSFTKCPNISIDHAVMEKTKIGTVFPLNVGWSDIGSWSAVWDNSEKDSNGNCHLGKVISKYNNNCYLRSESKLIVGIGLSDLIVIETSDAILISEKSFTQKIKTIVEDLKRKGVKEGITHKKVFRPWGNYESIANDERWQVKLISVKPEGKLSLQMHHHRAEHWIVVKGTAKVEINEKEIFLSENQSTFIPLGSKHRLINPGKIPLLLIEVQSGSYLGEDDIKRFADSYGRLN